MNFTKEEVIDVLEALRLKIRLVDNLKAKVVESGNKYYVTIPVEIFDSGLLFDYKVVSIDLSNNRPTLQIQPLFKNSTTHEFKDAEELRVLIFEKEIPILPPVSGQNG